MMAAVRTVNAWSASKRLRPGGTTGGRCFRWSWRRCGWWRSPVFSTSWFAPVGPVN